MPKIDFKATLSKIGTWTILRLPKNASAKLPSRGMAIVDGTINGFPFQTALEPDGVGSHWFKVEKIMQKGAKVEAGDTATLSIEVSSEWPEPNVPADLMKALEATPRAHSLWKGLTPMARWDWIRWIGSTKNPETRKKHIEVTFSKLKNGIRRPCCFNRTICTVADVAIKGVLLLPT
ncbi:MAG TPA: YdeI/OmpD-associated family protein [Patescibacteria group bacterium]|nr:YdeI/OmpD-associated family protein [Patescibacteria group bacterium]